jgi:hypothetical protein
MILSIISGKTRQTTHLYLKSQITQFNLNQCAFPHDLLNQYVQNQSMMAGAYFVVKIHFAQWSERVFPGYIEPTLV